MRLTRLAHDGFRNLEPASIELAPTATVLLGDNGQGKTNLLEAVGVLATGRSFRRARMAEMARHGERDFTVRGTVEADSSGSVDLSIAFTGGRRTTSVGRAGVELTEYVSHLTVVPITQAQAGVVRGGPQERRDFLDRGIVGVRPGYLRTLGTYRRTLKHANALLRRGDGAAVRAELEAWHQRLAESGAELVLQRRAYLAQLREALEGAADDLLPEDEQLTLDLADVVSRSRDPQEAEEEPGRAEVVQALRERLDGSVDRALGMGQVTVGPHRDELAIGFRGRDIRRFASSGQQRNALLALKMAKVEVFSRERSQSPVVLVDDVDTEVDVARLERFLLQVGRRAQAVLTSSKLDLFRREPAEARFFRVRAGVITPA